MAAPQFLASASKALRTKIQRYLLPDSFLMRRQYLHRHGFRPDLDAPKDLSEKLLWLKLHDRSPLHTQCADKIRAREYVAARIGPEIIIPAIRITYDPAEINPEAIPDERFVIKTNHDQGGVFVCRDRATFDWEGVREKVAKRLAINKYYEFREYQYKDIRPGVLVENYIGGDDGGNVREIKFYCFHGQPRFIQVVLDRFENRREINYDTSWNRMPFSGPATQLEYELPRPQGLDELMRDAATLSDPFLFCRIDYLLGEGDRAWFGEITFHHGAGLIRFQPDTFERAFGDMIDLSRIEETRRRQREFAAAARATAAWPQGRAQPRAG